MKKMFLSLLAVMFACSVHAQDFGFPVNEFGESVVMGSVKTSHDAKYNAQVIRAWTGNQGFSVCNQISEEPGKSITYNIVKNTKSSYNPFAGQFVENLVFNLVVKFNGENVDYEFRNIQIQEIYAGFGASNKTNSVAQFIENVKNAKAAIEAAQQSGDKKALKKAKKEHEDTIENGTETLQKAWGEFQKFEAKLKESLQK